MSGIFYSVSQLIQAIWNDTFLPFSSRTVRTIRSVQQINTSVLFTTSADSFDITIATLFDYTRARITWQSHGFPGSAAGAVTQWLLTSNTNVRIIGFTNGFGAPTTVPIVFTVDETY